MPELSAARTKAERLFYERLQQLSAERRAIVLKAVGDPPDFDRLPLPIVLKLIEDQKFDAWKFYVLIYILAFTGMRREYGGLTEPLPDLVDEDRRVLGPPDPTWREDDFDLDRPPAVEPTVRAEAERWAIWSVPETRARLLAGLSEHGFGADQLAEMQRIIQAEKSDLFDVLAYVAYALPTRTRDERAAMARVEIGAHFNAKQQAFLDFVLAHYVSEGVQELDREKLNPLLRLRYNDSISDAIADLGPAAEIGSIFSDFQQYLYLEVA